MDRENFCTQIMGLIDEYQKLEQKAEEAQKREEDAFCEKKAKVRIERIKEYRKYAKFQYAIEEILCNELFEYDQHTIFESMKNPSEAMMLYKYISYVYDQLKELSKVVEDEERE